MAKARHYELNEFEILEREFSGQAALLIKTLTDEHPLTAAQIAERVKSRLQTRQDPLRVVSFYLSTWKRQGVVKVVDAPEAGNGSQPAEAADDEIPTTTPIQGFTVTDPSDDFDFTTATLADSIRQILDIDGASTPAEIAERLQVYGKTCTPKSVADACRKLVAKGKVLKAGDGIYDLEPE